MHAVITSFAEALEVLRSPLMETSSRSPVDDFMKEHTLLRLDGPEHASRRRTLNQLLKRDGHTRFRERALHPAVEEGIRGLLAARQGREPLRTDLLAFGDRLFVRLAGTLVGLDVQDTDAGCDRLVRIKVLAAGVNRAPTEDTSLRMDDALAALADFGELVDAALARRAALLAQVDAGTLERSALPDDVMMLMAALAEPAWSARDVAVREALVIFRAAINTSVNTMTQTVDELARWCVEHPEDRARLTSPEFLIGAVHDALRLHPVITTFPRRAREALTLASGRQIKKGEVVIVHADAGKDPAVFGENPEGFDPRRAVRQGAYPFGLGFGSGPHMCFGQPLALGAEGIDGSVVHVLSRLYAVGLRPDPERLPQHAEQGGAFTTYPVLIGESVAA